MLLELLKRRAALRETSIWSFFQLGKIIQCYGAKHVEQTCKKHEAQSQMKRQNRTPQSLDDAGGAEVPDGW